MKKNAQQQQLARRDQAADLAVKVSTVSIGVNLALSVA